jgi:hypothetical protein
MNVSVGEADVFMHDRGETIRTFNGVFNNICQLSPQRGDEAAMTQAYRTVIDKFAQLSDGDRSCVLAMLGSPPADQMTSKGSAHDQFYLALERLGWAQRAKIDDHLEALGIVAAWTFTPKGRVQFPNMLAGAEINLHAEEYTQQIPLEFSRLALKFSVGYILSYVVSLSAVYGLTRMGVNVRPVQDVLSIGLIFAASAAGVFAALVPWAFSPDGIDDLQAIGRLQAISSNYKLLCACFTPLVFVFHVVAEGLILRFDPVQAARLVGTPVVRAAVMTALVYAGCVTVLPPILNAVMNRCARR